MACTSLRRLYSLLLITTVIFILYVKIITPLHSSKVILELKAIQGYVRQLENKVSMESLEANDRFKRFVRHMVEQLKPRRLQSFMIIMAQEGSIPWIENFLCSVSQFDLLPRISVFTVDRDTTLSINIKYPMISVFELNFDELLYDTPPEYDTQVRRRLFDIVRLRLAAVLSKNKLDVLIASPNQIWTANLFKRVLYPIMVRKLARHGYELFVQEGENNKLVGEGLWLLTPDGKCNSSLLPDLKYVVPNHINAITHLKHMLLVADGTHIKTSRAPAFKPSTPNQVTDQPLLSTRDIDELQLDFERMARKPEVASIFPTLPRHFIYRRAIDQCFEDTYYKFHYSGHIEKLKCPGPDRCVFPRGIPCYNSAATFHSTTNSSRINIHFATEESFREENGCLP
ncbi:hypothetical protein GCK32_007926 [Trichostrongylus colubriformis]|uniref:Uncharacterized protein n=1 Tax=Trichostrongylus colubriformis TaxID=6319 RepID=A0AAN8FE80_TRICO